MPFSIWLLRDRPRLIIIGAPCAAGRDRESSLPATQQSWLRAATNSRSAGGWRLPSCCPCKNAWTTLTVSRRSSEMFAPPWVHYELKPSCNRSHNEWALCAEPMRSHTADESPVEFVHLPHRGSQVSRETFLADENVLHAHAPE